MLVNYQFGCQSGNGSSLKAKPLNVYPNMVVRKESSVQNLDSKWLKIDWDAAESKLDTHIKYCNKWPGYLAN